MRRLRDGVDALKSRRTAPKIGTSSMLPETSSSVAQMPLAQDVTVALVHDARGLV